MKVLSLFDGIGCARIALDRAGIKVDKYYSSEIDKNAIKILDNNYKDVIHLGDITKVTDEQIKDIGDIDLLIGGSPCQDFSIIKAGKGKGLDGEKSGLYYEYLRILKAVNPKYFILENVIMKREWEEKISHDLGVEPIVIDSALLSAAHRKRNYWTNIQNIEQPKDKGLLLRDIVVDAERVDKKYWYDKDFIYNGDDAEIQCTIVDDHWYRMAKEVHNINSKCNTLICCTGGHHQRKVYQDGQCRKLTPLEYERLMTVPAGYTYGLADTHRYNALGNAFTVDVIAHIVRHISNIKK
jgi:DNA (cytosine-5)-methyltransferase 3A